MKPKLQPHAFVLPTSAHSDRSAISAETDQNRSLSASHHRGHQACNQSGCCSFHTTFSVVKVAAYKIISTSVTGRPVALSDR